MVAAALCGAYLGFAPFNRPAAKVFLGDPRQPADGPVAGLVPVRPRRRMANWTAALLLPLYYLVDATLTLLRRLSRGEKVWLAHRSHFYQRATDNGFTVSQVVGHVFALNIILAALAGLAVAATSMVLQIVALATGLAAVAFVLGSSHAHAPVDFGKHRPPQRAEHNPAARLTS